MKATLIEKPHDPNLVASMNRRLLRENNVLAIRINGGPGCGKTTLIEAAIQRLGPALHVGVIACDISSHLDADRITRKGEQVVQINTGMQGLPDAIQIHDAIAALNLAKIDILFIENIGSLSCGCSTDLGQDLKLATFSVAAGHDKAQKHPELVRDSNLIVLNKTDLLYVVPFDLPAFRADVRSLNPSAELFEMSALTGDGVDRWVEWLRARVTKREQHTSNWFG